MLDASAALPKPFEIHGTYAGFVRTLLGQRRMLLRHGEEEVLLKVPKELRHLLDARLKRGELIAVWGEEVIEKRSGLPRLLVSRVQSESGARGGAGGGKCLVCPILVCAKKNCWRSGGKELFSALERELGAHGLAEMVEVHEVQCLGHCDDAPNCEWNDHEYHRCAPKDARWVVERIVSELR